MDPNFIYLILIPLFSKYILKENIYKHQIFSLIISIFPAIFIFISTLLESNNSEILFLPYQITTAIIYSLIIVLIKFLMDKYYISPYKILLFIGVGSTILNIIINIIYSLIVFKDLLIITQSFNFPNPLLFSFYIIMILVIGFFYQILMCLAIFYFPPSLIIITDIIFFMIYFLMIEGKFGNLNDFKGYFELFGYIIILIFVLIYNEIIICNFWGLNKDTKKYILERQREESNSLEQDDNIYENEEEE